MLCAAPAHAAQGSFNISGFLEFESRFFTQTPRHSGQVSEPSASLALNPEFRYRSADRRHRFSLVSFYRHDSLDIERTDFDIQEAYWLWVGDNIEILTGVNRVFWGVTESRHLVNIVNQINGVEDIDGEDYLGQLMINFSTQHDWGRLDTYILPGFRARTFTGEKGRFRPATLVDNARAEYQNDAAEDHVDFAMRYSHYFDNWDLGLSYFYGTDREPTLSLNAGGTRLIPRYQRIQQLGIDVQYTYDAWLWKLESIVRDSQMDTFFAAVGGFEYTFYQVASQAWDVGLLTEYQYDNRDSSQPLTLADNDLFIGARLALNDIQDTAILFGFSVDHDTGERFYNFEGERRLGQHYQIEVRARFFSNAKLNDFSFYFASDDYLQLTLSRHF